MSQGPFWIEASTARTVHRMQLAMFGGLDGIRDDGMLESAIARPVNLWLYEQATLFRLAASYAYGITMNHPFIDGNKRTAFVVSVLFLERNGLRFVAPEVDAATMFLSLAAGELGERELSEWFEQWCGNVYAHD